MFGIADPAVYLAYLACILCVIFCVGYGIRNWNKGDESVSSDDERWVSEERKKEEEI